MHHDGDNTDNGEDGEVEVLGCSSSAKKMVRAYKSI
jgi:hypothetical protein